MPMRFIYPDANSGSTFLPSMLTATCFIYQNFVRFNWGHFVVSNPFLVSIEKREFARLKIAHTLASTIKKNMLSAVLQNGISGMQPRS
jgi:hypothetical protein